MKRMKRFPPSYKNFRAQQPSQKRKFKLKKIGTYQVVYTAVVVFLIGVIFITGMFAWASRDLPNPDKLMTRSIEQSTKIYDKEGEFLLYDIYNEEKRTLVELEQIPEHMKWATISAEDKLFYEHKGFNLIAMFKGVILDPLTGKRARGGSTLTQQLVKNAILTNERKISRKIKEFILSYRIEQAFSKDEILQMYLNEIPYGSVAYGVGAAVQTFLGKDVEELTLAESAYLAALPKAPTYYSPYGSHVDKLEGRQKYILERMAEDGFITEEEAEEAKNEEVEFVKQRDIITAPHFVMFIKEYLGEKYGDLMVESGLKVITTLDLNMQDIAEQAVERVVEERGEKYGFSNAALVAIDPKNGQIRAMVGSKDFFDDEIDGQVNVTTRLRQPGSSIKPMIYSLGFSFGYQPETILFDALTHFKGSTKTYTPYNYDFTERGPISVRQAIAGSINIPAVKMAYLTGVQNIIKQLQKLGYTSFEEKDRFGLSIVLGGGEVQLLEHVSAYGAFAREGLHYRPTGILRIEDQEGNVLEEFKEKKKRVWSVDVAQKMNSILTDDQARAFAFGTGSYLTLGSRPAGAKTGTTNDYRDAWTVGYTPSLVAGVWAGNNDNTPMKKSGGFTAAAPIWNEFMSKATASMPVEHFNDYEKSETGKPIIDGNLPFEQTIKIDKHTGKLATEFTPESFIEEQTYTIAHNILYYVKRDNPLGDAPKDPAKYDWQYENWESAVQEWVAKNTEGEFISDLPPMEEDDVHTAENQPKIHIMTPPGGQTIDSETLVAHVKTNAPRGVIGVKYYLDGYLISNERSYPYSLNYKLSKFFKAGKHKLRAVVYDDVENADAQEVEITTTTQGSGLDVQWLNLQDGNSLFVSSFPFKIQAKIFDLDFVKQVKFYSKKSGHGAKLISMVLNPSGATVELNWGEEGAGDYQLWPVVIDLNGEKHLGQKINVTVNE